MYLEGISGGEEEELMGDIFPPIQLLSRRPATAHGVAAAPRQLPRSGRERRREGDDGWGPPVGDPPLPWLGWAGPVAAWAAAQKRRGERERKEKEREKNWAEKGPIRRGREISLFFLFSLPRGYC